MPTVIIASTLSTLAESVVAGSPGYREFSSGYRKGRVGTSIAFPSLSGLSARFNRRLLMLNRRALTSVVVALATTIATQSFAQDRGTGAAPAASAKAGATQGTFTTSDAIPWKPVDPSTLDCRCSRCGGIQTRAPQRSYKSFLRAWTRVGTGTPRRIRAS